MRALTFILRVATALSLVLVTGVDFYSSPFEDTNLQFQEYYSHLDVEHQTSDADGKNHEVDSHKCHGRVSCDIQTMTPALRLVELRTAKAELLVATLSIDRSVYSLHPEPPPPEV